MEIIACVRLYVPVQREWYVNGMEINMWVDACSLAVGLSLEVNRLVMKDAC